MDTETTVISNSGVKVPRIIYGTAWKKEQTAELVKQAIALGFRGIDTACQPKHYHELGVGEALSASLNKQLHREQIYLQTKFTPISGQDPENIPYNPLCLLRKQVQQSMDVSLSNLQTEYLDCLLLHSPLATFSETQQVWQAMEKGVSDAKIKQLGISNCYDLDLFIRLYNWAEIKPAILQNRFYKDTEYDKHVRQFCRDNGIIYQSFWSLTANPDVLAHRSLLDLAAKYKKTPAQVFFRYLTHVDVVPLTGTTSVTHMREDLDIFEFSLMPLECEAIEALL